MEMIVGPGGNRNWSDGKFYNLGTGGNWWSSTPIGSSYAHGRELNYNQAGVNRYEQWNRSNGFSVRCVRNSNI